jgi:hypothetical protein
MKPKLFSTLIIIVIATGTAIIPLAGGAAVGTEPMRTVFFAFVSAIIAIQVVPAIVLLGGLIKAALSGGERKQEG